MAGTLPPYRAPTTCPTETPNQRHRTRPALVRQREGNAAWEERVARRRGWRSWRLRVDSWELGSHPKSWIPVASAPPIESIRRSEDDHGRWPDYHPARVHPLSRSLSRALPVSPAEPQVRIHEEHRPAGSIIFVAPAGTVSNLVTKQRNSLDDSLKTFGDLSFRDVVRGRSSGCIGEWRLMGEVWV